MGTCFAESHAAAIKHTVIRVEKTMGMVKAYLQLKAVIATKQMASAHAMLRKVLDGARVLFDAQSLDGVDGCGAASGDHTRNTSGDNQNDDSCRHDA